jgi:hypothetical protein
VFGYQFHEVAEFIKIHHGFGSPRLWALLLMPAPSSPAVLSWAPLLVTWLIVAGRLKRILIAHRGVSGRAD